MKEDKKTQRTLGDRNSEVQDHPWSLTTESASTPAMSKRCSLITSKEWKRNKKNKKGLSGDGGDDEDGQSDDKDDWSDDDEDQSSNDEDRSDGHGGIRPVTYVYDCFFISNKLKVRPNRP